MNRIKSYTVVEMLVVMLVSALSIGIAYTCYTIFSKQYLSYKKNSEALAEYMLLDRLLTKDIAACKRVEKTNEGIVCNFQHKTVQYEFYEEYLLRREGIIDTFHIRLSEAPEYKQFEKPEYLPGSLLDELGLVASYKEEQLTFRYKKKYGADVLMSMEESR